MKGVKDSDIPAHLSGTTQGDGSRERAPVRGTAVSDIPAKSPGCDLNRWETRGGVREGGEGLE